MKRLPRHLRDERQLPLPLACSINYSDRQYLSLDIPELAWWVIHRSLRRIKDDPDAKESEEILLWVLNHDSDFSSWCTTAGLVPMRIQEAIKARFPDQTKRLAKKLVAWVVHEINTGRCREMKAELLTWVRSPSSDFREWMELAGLKRHQPWNESERRAA